MTTEEWETLRVQTFGLTPDLFVPIAAADLETIDSCVGTIETHVPGRKRPTPWLRGGTRWRGACAFSLQAACHCLRHPLEPPVGHR